MRWFRRSCVGFSFVAAVAAAAAAHVVEIATRVVRDALTHVPFR